MKLCGESDDLLEVYTFYRNSHIFSSRNRTILDTQPRERVMFCVNKCGEIPKKFTGIWSETWPFIDVVDREHGRPETYDKLI